MLQNITFCMSSQKLNTIIEVIYTLYKNYTQNKYYRIHLTNTTKKKIENKTDTINKAVQIKYLKTVRSFAS